MAAFPVTSTSSMRRFRVPDASSAAGLPGIRAMYSSIVRVASVSALDQ
jgi:hypothetical protein